jgi:gluconokinase
MATNVVEFEFRLGTDLIFHEMALPIPASIIIIVIVCILDTDQNTLKTLGQGVTGSGKSTVGKQLAAKLALPFIDGDDLHPKENIDKMSRGEPLNDKDRGPWLRRIREEINPGAHEQGRRPTGLIVACSALKKSYRDLLRGRLSTLADVAAVDGNVPPGGLHPALDPIVPTFFVHLTGSHGTLYRRMVNREGHYMKENMLDSQLRTLEPPSDEEKSEDVIQVDIEATTDIEAQVEFVLNSVKRLAKDRSIIGLKEDLCTNHPATTMKLPGAHVSIPGEGWVAPSCRGDRHI